MCEGIVSRFFVRFGRLLFVNLHDHEVFEHGYIILLHNNFLAISVMVQQELVRRRLNGLELSLGLEDGGGVAENELLYQA